jgi:hypothetical protein
MTVLRRLLVLSALCFWTGGFTFYASVVVPVGAEVLGSHREQGYITQKVSNYMNLAGVVALPLFAWEVASSRDPSRRRRLARWLAWLGMGLTLAILVGLHPTLDAILAHAKSSRFDSPAFRPVHRLYLWTTTVQWGFALTYLLLSVVAWRFEDALPVN